MKMTWNNVQANSDSILADGLWILSQRPRGSFSEIEHNGFGNYLISYDKGPYYIGEAKDVCKRMKQQFKPETSTFYKNYLKLYAKNSEPALLQINQFQVQHVPTLIGRKEMEEFGIVNFPTKLNGFQLGKRAPRKIISFDGIWEEAQNLKSQLLKEGEKEIFKQSFWGWLQHEVVPRTAGLYVVKDKNENLIYIGESSDINERHNTHSNRTYFSALRRHIATEILSFELKAKNGKKKYLDDNEEAAVNKFLKNCKVTFFPVNLGRYELEEYLIKKHKPLLNRKDNKD